MDVFNRGPRDRGDGPAYTMRPAVPGLRAIVIGVAVLLGLIILFSLLVRVTRIEAGHVGVEINLAGKQRGASEIPVRTGWVVYSPLTTQIIEFPTYVQTVKWTRDTDEGHPDQRRDGIQLQGRHGDFCGRVVVLRDRADARRRTFT